MRIVEYTKETKDNLHRLLNEGEVITLFDESGEVFMAHIYNKDELLKKEEKLEEEITTLTTKEQINEKVISMIREKYDINKEFEMQRRGIIEPNDLEYKEYLTYVNECISWGKVEKAFIEIKDKIINENKTFIDLINNYELTATQKRMIRTRLENENLI